jgi:hypothetical protein
MAETFARKRFCVFVGLLLLLFVSGQMDAQTSSLSTGIEGIISVGPIHGGPTRAGEPDSAPLANVAFEVANDAGAVTTFTTDASGHFRIPLAPGRYSIKRRDSKTRFERCGPFEVEVATNGFKKIQWECDSGMR